MPSGSHGGSSGSHSSGGSSFGGGGSSWGSSGSHSSSRPYQPRTFIFFGRTHSVRGSASFLSFLCLGVVMFAFIFMIGGFCVVPSEKKQVEKIKEDYAYYQDLIALGYTSEAKVTDMFSNAGRYYITYEINIPNSLSKLEGYSYSVYSREEAFSLLNQTIIVALNHPYEKITLKTDSVPIDYKDMPLTKDGEYVNAVKGVKRGWIFGFSGLGTIVLAVVVNFIIVKTKGDKAKINEKTSTFSSSDNSPKYNYCSYCGGQVEEGKRKCPSCGSRIQK